MSVSRLISETSKLCSNLCFLSGFHFFKLFLQAAAVLYSSSSAIAVSSKHSSTSSSSLWQFIEFIEFGQEFPSYSRPNFQIHKFCKFSGFIVFLYFSFSPFDKIQILYNYIIHVLSILIVWVRIVGTSCFLLFAWGRVCENRPFLGRAAFIPFFGLGVGMKK